MEIKVTGRKTKEITLNSVKSCDYNKDNDELKIIFSFIKDEDAENFRVGAPYVIMVDDTAYIGKLIGIEFGAGYNLQDTLRFKISSVTEPENKKEIVIMDKPIGRPIISFGIGTVKVANVNGKEIELEVVQKCSFGNKELKITFVGLSDDIIRFFKPESFIDSMYIVKMNMDIDYTGRFEYLCKLNDFEINFAYDEFTTQVLTFEVVESAVKIERK